MKPTLRLKRRSQLHRMQDTHPTRGFRRARGSAGRTVQRVEPLAAGAREAVAHRAVDARDWAAPRLEHAAESVQQDIAPRMSSALHTAAERSAPAREEARERGTAAFAALRGEEPARQRRRWPVAMLCFLLGGAAGAAAGVLGQRMAPQPAAAARPDRSPESAEEGGPADAADDQH